MPRRKKGASSTSTTTRTPAKSTTSTISAPRQSAKATTTPAPSPQVATAPKPKPADPLATLFETYASSNDGEQLIAEDGLASLFKDMSVDPDSRLAMIFAWQCNCTELGVISKDEFESGLKKLGFSSSSSSLTYIAQELRKKESALVRDMSHKNPDWKEFYTYGFNICKESAEKRGIDKNMAVAMLKLLLGESKAHVSEFCNYLELDASVKVVSQDVWKCFNDFSLSIKSDLSNYDEDEAWPCMIDQYVEHRKGITDENSEILVK